MVKVKFHLFGFFFKHGFFPSMEIDPIEGENYIMFLFTPKCAGIVHFQSKLKPINNFNRFCSFPCGSVWPSLRRGGMGPTRWPWNTAGGGEPLPVAAIVSPPCVSGASQFGAQLHARLRWSSQSVLH